jgi:hypothetical protein
MAAPRRPAIPPRQLQVARARLARRVESLGDHHAGLEQAVSGLGGATLDPRTWKDVFDSHDPLDIVARNGLTGCYSTIVNNYVELLKTSAYMAGLTPHRRDHAKDVIEAAYADGGISKDQAGGLHDLVVFEGRLQHASPDVDADEVRKAVELLRALAPELLKALVAWLTRHGVDVAGDAKGA